MSVQILIGDVRVRLAELAADSVDCVVTSPPYWGLRDYGVDGQIGMEPTLGEHIEVMVDVFREIRRVLKPTGTVWLNYGDCYATSPNGRSAADTKAAGNDDRTFRDKPFSTVGPINRGKRIERGSGRWGGGNVSDATLKPKDLCMIPNRLAIALQEAGWWVRSEIIWAKPNPMPESITDRPATAHEKVFMLTKSARYWYDAKAVRQAAAESSEARWAQDVAGQTGSTRANGGMKTNGNMKAVGGKQDQMGQRHAGFNARCPAGVEGRRAARNENANTFRGGSYVGGQPGRRTATGNVPGTNDRSLRNYEPAPVQVWNIATAAFSEAHFATFPPELAERCILAGCPAGGVVLDPFGGAGTVGLVASWHGRDCTLIELNEDYAAIAQRRIKAGLGEVSGADDQRGQSDLPLFAVDAAAD